MFLAPDCSEADIEQARRELYRGNENPLASALQFERRKLSRTESDPNSDKGSVKSLQSTEGSTTELKNDVIKPPELEEYLKNFDSFMNLVQLKPAEQEQEISPSEAREASDFEDDQNGKDDQMHMNSPPQTGLVTKGKNMSKLSENKMPQTLVLTDQNKIEAKENKKRDLNDFINQPARDIWKCQDCTYTTYFKNDLRIHKIAIKQRCGYYFINDQCEFEAETNCDLIKHTDQFHKSSDHKKMMCTKCGKQLSNQYALNKHDAQVHLALRQTAILTSDNNSSEVLRSNLLSRSFTQILSKLKTHRFN